MIALIAASWFGQASGLKPVWIVGPFRTRVRHFRNVERVVFDSVALRLREGGKIAVPETPWSNGNPTQAGLSRAVEDAAGNMDSTIFRGEILGVRLRVKGPTRLASASIHALAYDVVSGLRIADVRARGESTAHDEPEDVLVIEATKAASALAIRATQASLLPSVTILITTQGEPLIDLGTRVGYRKGTPVVVVRGRPLVGAGHVAAIEPDQAALVFDRAQLDFAPGDHVRPVLPQGAKPDSS